MASEEPLNRSKSGGRMERRAITVEGIVQGVGFRPFVYGLASRLGLSGHVRNQSGRVRIEAEGSRPALDHLLRELRKSAPPLARIDVLKCEIQELRGDKRFQIELSDQDAASPIFISPDVATCADCLAELFDPTDRHYRYPFLNCTNCGPRLTIIRGAPYDRGRTTMASFPMCPACAAEYDDPGDRRFHAQPAACPACGPRLIVCEAGGEPIDTSDPLACFVDALRRGQIGALKGLGGYHLACDAADENVVGELRRRKHRDEKPFAVMVPDLETVERLCEVGQHERDLLLSPRRPIVLLKKRRDSLAGAICDAVAPGNPRLGVMLPYSPLHHLLFESFPGCALVMTSANRSDEPIAYEDADALERLGEIGDLFLMHNRPIHVRCDDSVTRIVDAKESPIRRSRGYAPQPVRLPIECPRPILAVGGQLKGVFALGRGRQAFLSHHLGDLDHWEAYRAFVRDVRLYEELFAVAPALIVHDLHPDYASTNYARQRSAADQLPLLAVQHHHAHVASCMAEHGLEGPVIGVAFDGTGYGSDGAIWGGEFLVANYGHFLRAAHLRYVGLPGGDSAAREPWRMAATHLLDASCSMDPLENRIERAKISTVAKMLERGINTPQTSSAGRLFDAVASLAGVRDVTSYEGQAAIELEWLATDAPSDGTYPFELTKSRSSTVGEPSSPMEIDTRPLIRAVAADVARGTDRKKIARRFHSAIVEIIASACATIREKSGLETVALSGGVFMNALTAGESVARLLADGFKAYRHELVPANDGGICLGQAAIGAASLIAGTSSLRASELHAPRQAASPWNSPLGKRVSGTDHLGPASTAENAVARSPAELPSACRTAPQEG
jgi:hydrogenase maturation protein HypF